MREWFVYIPEEGDWSLRYTGDKERDARLAYLAQFGVKRMPAGSRIWSRPFQIGKQNYVVVPHTLKAGDKKARRWAVFNNSTGDKVRDKGGKVRVFKSGEPAQDLVDKFNRELKEVVEEYLENNPKRRKYRKAAAKGYRSRQRRT